MPDIALLGGTGSIGLAGLRCLLNTPLPSAIQSLSVSVLVRSRAKFLVALPRLAEPFCSNGLSLIRHLHTMQMARQRRAASCCWDWTAITSREQC